MNLAVAGESAASLGDFGSGLLGIPGTTYSQPEFNCRDCAARGEYLSDSRATEYSDFGSETNPKLALRYRPNGDLMVRGSISQGFRAPSLFELNQRKMIAISQAFLIDPCSVEENVFDSRPECHQTCFADG